MHTQTYVRTVTIHTNPLVRWLNLAVYIYIHTMILPTLHWSVVVTGSSHLSQGNEAPLMSTLGLTNTLLD